MSGDSSPAVDRSRIERYFVSEPEGTDPRLLGSECVDCGAVQFPTQDLCPDCWGSTRDSHLSRTGSLYAYSTVGMGPPAFDPPYTIGYVDLPDGVRVFSKISAAEEHLSVDRTMEVAIETVAVEDGVETRGYVFRPLERSE